MRTTIFPTLSQQIARDQLVILGFTAIKSLSLLSFIIMPVSAGLIILRFPVIQLLFERGAFDAAATHNTANLLGLCALGLPAMGGMWMVNTIYFSLGDPYTQVKFNILNWGIFLGLSWLLVQWLGSRGIALSISISTTAIYGLAILNLKRKLSWPSLHQHVQLIIKAFIATCVMVIPVLGIVGIMDKTILNRYMAREAYLLMSILGGTVVGGGVYGLAAVALRMEEALALVHSFQQWTRHRGLVR